MSTKTSYRQHSTAALVELYERAASEHGAADSRGQYSDGNTAADRVAAICREIRSRGIEHKRMLLPLLLSGEVGVNSWAAAHALEFEAKQGEAILTEIAKRDDVHAFNAKMVLKEWRDGNLRFP